MQKIFDHVMDLKADGSFRLNLEYFDYCTGTTMTNRKFAELFGGPPRKPEEPLTKHHMDLAASVQAALEEAVLRMTCSLASQTRMRNLCIAGGVGLNCVANGKVLRTRQFEGLWIQPASGDAGGAVGAALAAYYIHGGRPRQVNRCTDGMKGAYLGPSFETYDIERRLKATGARLTTYDDADLLGRTVEALVEGKAVGWFQGRMEFGARALGNRAILADARSRSI